MMTCQISSFGQVWDFLTERMKFSPHVTLRLVCLWLARLLRAKQNSHFVVMPCSNEVFSFRLVLSTARYETINPSKRMCYLVTRNPSRHLPCERGEERNFSPPLTCGENHLVGIECPFHPTFFYFRFSTIEWAIRIIKTIANTDAQFGPSIQRPHFSFALCDGIGPRENLVGGFVNNSDRAVKVAREKLPYGKHAQTTLLYK